MQRSPNKKTIGVNESNQPEKMTERIELLPGKVLVLPHILSEEECKKYIQTCEKKGFKQATINVGQETVQKEEIRNNDTVIIDDKDLADILWQRVQGLLHKEFSTSEDDETQAVCLSDHFRFYRDSIIIDVTYTK